MNCPKVAMSEVCDKADSQRSLTANIMTAMVATRNSGTDTSDTAVTFTIRSNKEPRYMAEVMPSASATGTETAAVTPASNNDAGSRPAIICATGELLTSEMPGLPDNKPINQWA